MTAIDATDLEALFDAVPDVLFFVKDREGRYTYVNQTMLRRLGLKSRQELIGKRVAEVYPIGLGANYANQDEQVLAGAVIDNVLELHLFANRETGWCLTCKRPLWVDGEVRGIIGISRDLGPQEGRDAQRDEQYEKLRLALAYLHAHYTQPVRLQTLVELTGFSMSKLQRSFRRVFQLTPQQVLLRLRLHRAMQLLDERKLSITDIGHACGFSDQSAFTRQFKAATGLTPREYRGLPVAQRGRIQPALPSEA
ncbi:AraC family transcriptional regulator [Stenotrophomonas panacihumi]|uniref:AraC family transcriptional regulator n=1 Tax=Stenotrophomonas panacihumi TaxID=676599 RepID=A0A0R0ABJ9_9GAMM|nr:AraC family transcriptional regulator [Stenotrophomonas panacihumi]KRG42347.1 AraC family transcriptional regulator [Stenotrophomonas panacihumi]PTN54511.1 AraC family transcriptional regulator [Stenotrophomonas panacihumi]